MLRKDIAGNYRKTKAFGVFVFSWNKHKKLQVH